MTRIEREWMRGAGPLAVLKLLDEGEMYGYELAAALEERSDGVLAMGHSTLYPMLYNLEAKGWVEPHRRISPEGRERKYYSLTPEGRTHLAAHEAQWRSLVSAMGRIGLAGGDAG